MYHNIYRPGVIIIFCTFVFGLLLVGCGEKQISQVVSRFEIQLSSRSFIPDPGIEDTLTNLLKTTEKASIHALIQFRSALSLDQHQTLDDLGLILQGYLGSNTYMAALPRGTDFRSGKLKKMVRWSGLLHPRDKLDQAMLNEQYEEWAVDSLTGKLKLLVEFFPDISPETVRQELRSINLSGKRYGANNSWSMLVDRDAVSALSRLETVRMVQQGPIPFLPLNEGSRRKANSDAAQQLDWDNPQPAYRRVSGAGIRIGICDGGIREEHNDFDQVTIAGGAGISRVYDQTVGGSSHGTHVASIAGGNGIGSIGFGHPAFALRGHAPRSMLGDYGQFGGDAQLFYDAIVLDATQVTNHSYVQSYSIYDNNAASIDLIVRGDAIDDNDNPIPAAPQVWAAGNNGIDSPFNYGNEEGYYSVFSSAKNSISVGSVDVWDGRLSSFSSRGPTFDGRIKPDIVAPGSFDSNPVIAEGLLAANVTAANPQGYTEKSGTSMAAPVVSAAIALMMEQYSSTFGIAPNLLPSTYKAILIHTAKDMVKTQEYADREFDDPDLGDPIVFHSGPDYATGFGLINTDHARDKISKSDHWLESTIGNTTQVLRYCFNIPAGTDEMKVVLAWDDEAGVTGNETTAKLVNDLDLVLVDPDGNRVFPWTLDPLPLTANPGDGAADPIAITDINPAYRGEDHLNNVEMANVFLPQSGTWTAQVTASALPNGNTQAFSLVSSHEREFCVFFEPVDICDILPSLCEFVIVEWPIFTVADSLWIFDPRFPVVPIDKICQYVLDCPGCGGRGWEYCPGWNIQIDLLPKDAIVMLYNHEGEIILIDDNPGPARRIEFEKPIPGEQYFILITDSNKQPYKRDLNLNISIDGMLPGQ